MFDVVALGEVLIDFTPAGISSGGQRLFEQNPGGAPANVLTALANLGMNTAIIGKVGADMHGDFLRETLDTKKIDTAALLRDDTVFTTLAFVSLNASGDRNFSFARKPGADTCLRADELPTAILQNCRVFHFGSLSLTDEPARAATLTALKIARASGAIISYDPNYRAPLWSSETAAITQMRSVLKQIDWLKVSEEEVPLLSGVNAATFIGDDGAKARASGAQTLIAQGVKVVVVTRGAAGAGIYTSSEQLRVAARSVKVIDTTGAGDAFWGGFLYSLINALKPSAAATAATLSTAPTAPITSVAPKLSAEILTGAANFAGAVAAFCVQRRGAIPAMPTLADLRD